MMPGILRSARAALDEGVAVHGYTVGSEVGAGAYGEILHRGWARDGQEVTIVAARDRAPDRHARARIRRLARLRGSVEHPGLMRVSHFGEYADIPFFVTDPYPPKTLADLLTGRPIRPQDVLELFGRAAEALDLCHGRGLVHQTLGPSSFLAIGDHTVLDGFAVLSITPEASWGVTLPNVDYVPPEHVWGEPLLAAGNVYSLAALLVHALTGQPPYVGPGAVVTNSHVVQPPPRPSERVERLGSTIDDVIAWGMAKDPSHRPRSATALMESAAGALGLEPPRTWAGRVTVADAAARARQANRSARRRWRPRIALWVAAVVATAAAGGFAAGYAADPFSETVRTVGGADSRLISRLDESRGELRSQLAQTRDSGEQAEVAAMLSSHYEDTAEQADSPALVAAARRASRAYAELSDAAETGSANGFADASASVERAEERLEAAVRRAGKFAG